jgi:hypothetical protein
MASPAGDNKLFLEKKIRVSRPFTGLSGGDNNAKVSLSQTKISE